MKGRASLKIWIARVARQHIVVATAFALLAIFSISACADQPSSEWTANEAIAHLADEVWDDALRRHELKIQDPRFPVSSLPTRSDTGNWAAVFEVGGSWLIDTGGYRYRVFESGAPMSLVYRPPPVQPTPTMEPIVGKLSIGETVKIGYSTLFHSGFSNCSAHGDTTNSRSLRDHRVQLTVIDINYECPTAYVRLEWGSEFDKYTGWIKPGYLGYD